MEINKLVQNNETIQFLKSQTAIYDSQTYLKVFFENLDYSSIGKDSFIFQALTSENKELQILFSTLAITTKNQPFLFKGKYKQKKIIYFHPKNTKH